METMAPCLGRGAMVPHGTTQPLRDVPWAYMETMPKAWSPLPFSLTDGSPSASLRGLPFRVPICPPAYRRVGVGELTLAGIISPNGQC